MIARADMARLAGAGRSSSIAKRVGDDPAMIVWTGGTTGLPKGAWYDLAGLKAAAALSPPLGAPSDCRLVGTPFAHVGYMAKVREQAAEMARSIAEDGINTAGGVST